MIALIMELVGVDPSGSGSGNPEPAPYADGEPDSAESASDAADASDDTPAADPSDVSGPDDDDQDQGSGDADGGDTDSGSDDGGNQTDQGDQNDQGQPGGGSGDDLEPGTCWRCWRYAIVIVVPKARTSPRSPSRWKVWSTCARRATASCGCRATCPLVRRRLHLRGADPPVRPAHRRRGQGQGPPGQPQREEPGTPPRSSG